jgi:DNA-binding SARP family transcriptional activator
MDFQVLGPLVAYRNGQKITFNGVRQQRLLAMLLLNFNNALSFDQLVDELWADPPTTARRQVHNAMAALRRALTVGDVGVTTTDAGYQIDIRPDQLDAELFRIGLREAERAEADGRLADALTHLEQAVGLWHGPALSGFDGRYLGATAAALEEQRLSTLERVGQLRLLLGGGVNAIADLIKWVSQHPYRETLRGSLMLALAQAGRQSEALEVYQQGRRLIAEHLGLDPGAELQQLHADILRGAVLPSATPPQTASLRNGRRSTLQHDNVDFIGRARELEQLKVIASSPSAGVTIVTIDGVGGVGKTTLAVRLAHQLRDAYPDGQHQVDLGGYRCGQAPVEPDKALGLLLQIIGIPANAVPVDQDAQVAKWRAQTADKKLLVVLDNAVGEDQVRPLLPTGPGSLVLVTSRRRLTGLAGAVPFFLDLPHLSDGSGIFRQIAGQRAGVLSESATVEVVELCGRLPLAIRIAASRLRHRPEWTGADVAERLSEYNRRRRFLVEGDWPLATVLGLSYEYLGNDARRLLRLLGVHYGVDVDVHAAAALAEVPAVTAEASLDELVENNLLTQRPQRRYRLHKLVRDSARELAERHDSADERRAATRRILDYYLRLISMADLATTDNVSMTSRRTGAAVLTAEYANLVEYARAALEQGWIDDAREIRRAISSFVELLEYPQDLPCVGQLPLAAE